MSPNSHRRHRPPRVTFVSDVVATLNRRAPYWGPQLVVLAALLLDLALPSRLTVGPNWLLPTVEGLLLLGLSIASTHPSAHHSETRRRVAIALIAVVSAVNVVSLGLLAHQLLHHGATNGRALIFSGIALWGTNVLLFGLWYFELDRGGPIARARGEECLPDFLFVNMTTEGVGFSPTGWKPQMIDYLWLSFTTATAFSPTDTMPLTTEAKWLMSGQSFVSLAIVVLVVARAVNILS